MRLSTDAWCDILREVDTMLEDRSLVFGPEAIVQTGGFLLASDDGYPLDVVRATGPGEQSRLGPKSLTLDRGEAEYLAGLPRSHLVAVGHWHLHPRGIAVPSRTDLESAQTWGEQHHNWCLDVILENGDSGLRNPYPVGWITHRERGRWVCERLDVVK